MSETVKLIIEIEKEEFDFICKQAPNFITINRKIIANGIPLDDVKAEIDKAQEPYMTSTAYDEGVRFGLMLAYQIVDKCKEESEDKE